MGRADRILVIAAGVAFFAAASASMADRYGGALYWPALLSQFGATLLAVVLALGIDSRRERRALERHERSLADERTSEARKRLLALLVELERNQSSIESIVRGLRRNPPEGELNLLHWQLLDGTWASSGERLGDLLAEYDLVAELSTFYGRLEELRWRIRYRTQARDSAIDQITLDLAEEMRAEVAGLIDKVRAEEGNPVVRPVGLVHARAIGGAVIQTSASMTAENVPREPE
jgi:hypothetical protein